MEPPVLKDKSVYPDEKLIFSYIGKNRLHWNRFLDEIRKAYPGIEEQWKYYNDGKSWLFRFILKKKTVCWIGVLSDTFRITFYFGEKAYPLIENSSLPDSMKEEFINGKSYGKIKAVSIHVNKDQDIIHALMVADIKAKIK